MKKKLFILSILILGMLLVSSDLSAQCSICTKTAQQLGEKPAKALNGAIIYLAAAPMLIIGFITYKWRQMSKNNS